VTIHDLKYGIHVRGASQTVARGWNSKDHMDKERRSGREIYKGKVVRELEGEPESNDIKGTKERES
jgi:hypothetical protein